MYDSLTRPETFLVFVRKAYLGFSSCVFREPSPLPPLDTEKETQA